MQVQLHRSAQQCHEALAISRHLADAPQEPREATWLGLLRRELAELDERLSRQLLRLQSQTDRVMEVFVTSLEGKVAQVMSKQPLTEWKLAELGSNIKGLQEQLEMQARRGDAADARLQRFTTSVQSQLRKFVEVPEEKPSPSGLEGTDALKDAMLASLREDAPGDGSVTNQVGSIRGADTLARALQDMKFQMDSQIRKLDDPVSLPSGDDALKSELEDLKKQVLKLERETSDVAKVQEMHLAKGEAKVEQMLENATDSFMSLLAATNQHLDAAVVKQVALEEDLRHLTLSLESQARSSSSTSQLSLQESVQQEVSECISRGSFLQIDSLGAWEKRLRREHRLEAAALWEAIGELAEHIGADGARFIQVTQPEAPGMPASVTTIADVQQCQEVVQSQHPHHEVHKEHRKGDFANPPAGST